MKKMTPSLLCLATLVILSYIESTTGQGENLKNSIANNEMCVKKMGECDVYKAKSTETTDNLRVCCGLRGWARCTQNAIDSYCQGTQTTWERISASAPDLTSDKCKAYQFWTPECIYNNYQWEVIGAGAGAIAVVIILILICCCCCCRSKK